MVWPPVPSPLFLCRYEHPQLFSTAPASSRQPPVPEHRGQAAAGPAGVTHPVSVVTHHSGRGYGCPVLGAAAALCLLHPDWLPAASPTAPATASTSTGIPAAATTSTGVCGPPPGWSTAAQCQPDSGAPAATTLSYCTIHSSPVPYREPRPVTNGDRCHFGTSSAVPHECRVTCHPVSHLSGLQPRLLPWKLPTAHVHPGQRVWGCVL